MQTDPIGYGDGLNWHNYVGSDPINGTDPSGLKTDKPKTSPPPPPPIPPSEIQKGLESLSNSRGPSIINVFGDQCGVKGGCKSYSSIEKRDVFILNAQYDGGGFASGEAPQKGRAWLPNERG
jgi:hypothetical protein